MGIPTLQQPIVPSTATIAEVCPGYLQYRDLQGAVAIRFRDIAHANNVTMFSLSVIVNDKGVDPTGTNTSTASANGWILSSLTRFWYGVATEDLRVNHKRTSLTCVVLFLDALRTFVSRVAEVKSPSALVTRSVLLSTQTLAAFLVAQSPPLEPAIERQLCMTLFEFAFLSRKSGSMRRALREYVIPILYSSKEDQAHFTDFGPDLKV